MRNSSNSVEEDGAVAYWLVEPDIWLSCHKEGSLRLFYKLFNIQRNVAIMQEAVLLFSIGGGCRCSDGFCHRLQLTVSAWTLQTEGKFVKVDTKVRSLVGKIVDSIQDRCCC